MTGNGVGILTNFSSSTKRQVGRTTGRTFTGSGDSWGIRHCLVKFRVCGGFERETERQGRRSAWS